MGSLLKPLLIAFFVLLVSSSHTGAEERTEVIAERTTHSKTFQEKDGTRSIEVYPQSIFYKNNEHQWVPIENILVLSNEEAFKVQNKANRYDSLFGDEVRFRFRLGDSTVDSVPREARPEQVLVSKNKIQYKDVYPGVDIEFTAESDAVVEEWIISTPDAAHQFTMDMNLSKLALQENVNGKHYDLLDNKGQKVARLIPSITGGEYVGVIPKVAWDEDNHQMHVKASPLPTEEQYPLKVRLTISLVDGKQEKDLIAERGKNLPLIWSIANKFNGSEQKVGDQKLILNYRPDSSVDIQAWKPNTLLSVRHIRVDSGQAQDQEKFYLWLAYTRARAEVEKEGSITFTDTNGRRYSIKKDSEDGLRFVFDPLNEMYVVIRPDGSKMSFHKNGKLAKWTDSGIIPNVVTYTYNDHGKLVHISDLSNQNLTLYYNTKGQIASITDPGGNEIWYAYNEKGELQSISDQLQGVRMTWASFDNQEEHSKTANQQEIQYGKQNNWIWITSSKRITSFFGPRDQEFHKGVDVGATEQGVDGDPVWSMSDGIVQFAGRADGYGNVVYIYHPDSGVQTRYGHLKSIEVKTGDTVKKGSTIGRMGNTGDSFGTHLHFEILQNGQALNPSEYFDFSKPLWVFVDE